MSIISLRVEGCLCFAGLPSLPLLLPSCFWHLGFGVKGLLGTELGPREPWQGKPLSPSLLSLHPSWSEMTDSMCVLSNILPFSGHHPASSRQKSVLQRTCQPKGQRPLTLVALNISPLFIRAPALGVFVFLKINWIP